MDAVLASLATKYAGKLTKIGLAQDPSLSFVTPDGVRARIDLWRLGGLEQTRFELTALERLPSFDIDARFLANLPTNDAEIDRAFASRCDDTALLRRLWAQPFARDLVRRDKDCRVSSKGTTLVVEEQGANEADIEELLELALQIVRFDVYGTGVVAQLPDATVVSMGGFIQAEVPGPAHIRVGPVTTKDVTRTRAMLSASVEVAEDVRLRIAQLGAAVVVTALDTTIVWPTIEDSRDRLLAAIMILRQLAGTSLGAFR